MPSVQSVADLQGLPAAAAALSSAAHTPGAARQQRQDMQRREHQTKGQNNRIQYMAIL